MAENRKWRCKRCGYISDIELDNCPVCSAPWDEFEEILEPVKTKTTQNRKWKCKRCGYITDIKIDICPVCSAPWSEFEEVLVTKSGLKWADEHHIPENLKGFDAEYVEKIRTCFTTEITSVGIHLAMSRQAFREGYPEVGMAMKQIAFEEALHAARVCEILGEKVSASTEENLKNFVNNKLSACALSFDIATYSKVNDYDAVHDSIHDISKDEARHGKAVVGLLKRYFNVDM